MNSVNTFARDPETGECRIDCITLRPYLRKYDIVLGKSHHDARSMAMYLMAGGLTHPLTRKQLAFDDAVMPIFKKINGELGREFLGFMLNRRACQVLVNVLTAEFVQRLRLCVGEHAFSGAVQTLLRETGNTEMRLLRETTDAKTDLINQYFAVTRMKDNAPKIKFIEPVMSTFTIPDGISELDFHICTRAIQNYLTAL